MYYASVADVIEASNTPNGNANTNITAANKATLLRYIRTVSARIDLDFGARQLFLPQTQTRRFLLESSRINSGLNTFRLDGSLLALSALTVAGTVLTLTSQVAAYPDADVPPFREVRLVGGLSWYGYCATDGSLPFVVVTGTWGLHRDYARAWLKVDDLAADINASVNTLTVADADGEDPYGFTPRFSPGQVLRIEGEYFIVTKVDTGTNALTVLRGQLGTTAAAHSAGSDVEVFQTEDAIRQVVARQSSFLWSRQGAYTSVEIQGISELRYPPDLLAELRSVEQDYANGF